MSSITVTKSSQVRLSPECLGIARISDNPNGSIEIAERLLQKNHDENHMFWRDIGGHNHVAHSILSILALGGSPAELQRAYDDSVAVQRPMPPLDEQVVRDLADPVKFRARIGQIDNYTNFLVFFEQEMEAKGWKAVVQEYCFSRTPNAETMLSQLYEGAYHPIIHFGLGVEFEQPSIIAEGLAQAISHESSDIEPFFLRSEQEALKSENPNKPLLELYNEVRATDKIRFAARLPEGPTRVRDGVMKRAGQEIATLASQFRIKPHELERGTAEMINCCAYSAGAAQRAGKARKIDFFHMHNVTSSIFLSVLVKQPWISIEDKVRLVEWKGRHDLVWYAASSAAELHLEDITNYKPTKSAGMDWSALYTAINIAHDDGHVAKFARALKNGQEVSKPFEQGEGADAFPVKGDMWLKIAQMCYDTTLDLPGEEKWIWGVGFDPLWAKIPAME